MSIDAKSFTQAAALNDTFRKHGWDAFLIKAYATATADRVDLEYASATHGGVRRRVSADPVALQSWLRRHAEERWLWHTLEGILARKPESPKPPTQTELDLGELAPAARRSMLPQ